LREVVDPITQRMASEIVQRVRDGGEKVVREYGEHFLEIKRGDPLRIDRSALKAAFENLPEKDRALLRRTGDRVQAFAAAQRASVRGFELDIAGGVAGQEIVPVERAGCYAPGGRFPLPSSVLMTVVTARAAGVKNVFVASPKPMPITLAAAYAAGADALLPIGGAHAIAAMTYGIKGIIEPCDVIVGPGNKFVTAAKQIVAGRVGIDMLAGPSELVVLADDTADPLMVAADLLAQAEHDPDALPILVTASAKLIEQVNAEIAMQLADLPTRIIAESSLKNGYAVLCGSLQECIDVTDLLAPEHLEVITRYAEETARRVKHYGGLFIGGLAAEVLGDYGAGPNHTLPTSGGARSRGGLSVFNFLRIRTWIRIDSLTEVQPTVEDSIRLAQHEGLEGHARSAAVRLL